MEKGVAAKFFSVIHATVKRIFLLKLSAAVKACNHFRLPVKASLTAEIRASGVKGFSI